MSNSIHKSTNSLKLKIILFSIFAIIIIAASITYFSLSIGKPFMGISLAWDAEGWKIQELDPNGIAFQSGIKIGEKVTEVDGSPAQNFLNAYKKPNLVFVTTIREVTVIDNGGQLKTVSVENNSPSWSSITEQISWFIISLVFWIIGFFVFLKRPRNLAALLLCLCSLVSGLALATNTAGERAIASALQITMPATVIGPWIMVHFSLVLPEERAWFSKNPLVYFIYLPAIITLILLPIMGIGDNQPLPGFRNFRLIEYGTGFLAAAGIMVFNYFRATSHRTRQQMKIVMVSCLCALIPIVVLNLIPATIWGQSIIPFGFSILFLIFIPLGMGYAVVTQKLLDIDVIIRRGMIYALITIIMAVILSIAIFPILALHISLSIPQEILLALVLGGIATALFGPTKKGIEYLIDRFFYKDRYDYRQIIHVFSASLNSLKEFNEIARLIVGTMVNTLNLAGGSLFASSDINRNRPSFDLRAAQGVLAEDSRQMPLMYLISHRDRKYDFPNSASPLNPDLAYIIPIMAGDKEIGTLFLAPKVSRQNFSSDDVYLLQGLASVGAAALRSSMLTHDVSQRDIFVSIASHELHTSLTHITGYASLLINADRPRETQKQWLKNIHESGERITSMVDDLLNVSRIHTGQIQMKIEKVKLEDVLNRPMSMTKEGTKIHELVTDLEADLPEALVDRDKFGQVLWNLLNNAVKYSPQGGRITVAARVDRSQDLLVVSVADQGIGISPEDKEYLFKTFHRIDRPETRTIRGSGLGLYIVKEWTEAMGGKIWLESVLNQGSTFFLAFPISESKQKQE
jgi:signal transduction histidine kinase